MEVVFTMRMTQEQMAMLSSLAAMTQRSKASVVRLLISQAFNNPGLIAGTTSPNQLDKGPLELQSQKGIEDEEL